ncbi:MAG: PKD domain-containing protein, partial [Chloroflexota bacterium]
MINYRWYFFTCLFIIALTLTSPISHQPFIKPGDRIYVTGHGVDSQHPVQISLVSISDSDRQPLVLTDIKPDPLGNFGAEVTVPQIISSGQYDIRVGQPESVSISQYEWVAMCVEGCSGTLASDFVENKPDIIDGIAYRRPSTALWDGLSVGGYASKLSVEQGDSINFHVSTEETDYTMTVWKEGATRQLVYTTPSLTGTQYGCTEGYLPPGCEWPVAYTLSIPSDWPSGAYTVEIPTISKGTQYIIFWVREDNPGSTSSVLFLSSVNTFNAYTSFGGKSVYNRASTNNEYSPKVSFNRPFRFNGVGEYERFKEPDLITWAENLGYTFEYATNYDLEFEPDLLSNYEVVIIGGHSEYWSRPARDQVRTFINTGGRFMNLSGNTMWWQIRYEDNGRTLVVYKDEPDPVTNPTANTGRTHEPVVFDNEITLLGAQWPYGGFLATAGNIFQHEGGYGGFWVQEPDHWVFDGLNLAKGDVVGRTNDIETSVASFEVDGTPFNCASDGNTILEPITNTGAPHNTKVLGFSPAYRDGVGFGTMSIYTTPAGGAMFGTNTTGWMTALLTDNDVSQVTQNVLDHFLANDFPSEANSPGPQYLFHDRFNCNNLDHTGVLPAYSGPAWYMGEGIAKQHYGSSNDDPTKTHLTNACGVDGSGLQVDVHPELRYRTQLKPNWAATDVLYAQVYLDFSNLTMAEGDEFILFDFKYDDQQTTQGDIATLFVSWLDGKPTLRYLEKKNNQSITGVEVPANEPFLLEMQWDKPNNQITLLVDDQQFDQSTDLSASLPINRVDIRLKGLDAGTGGAICLDELILHDSPIDSGLVSPDAAFTYTVVDDVAKEIQFHNGSTGSDLSYLWDFGDGSATSTQQNPSHTYSEAGSYTVRLTVSNSIGTDVTTIIMSARLPT